MTLYRLPVAVCEKCERVPCLRLTERAIRDAQAAEPGEIWGTYQCHREKCRTIYPIAYIALQRAEVVRNDESFLGLRSDRIAARLPPREDSDNEQI